MIIDAPDWSDGETIDADLCIVGGGVIGLGIAHAFLDTKVRVLVLEAGGWTPTTRGQDSLWAEAEGVTNHSFAFSRFRAYGGSGGHWAGYCPALELLDFEGLGARPAWPLAIDGLDPWMRRAEALLDVPLPACARKAWEQRLGNVPDLGEGLRQVILPLARKRDVGQAYLAAFKASSNVKVVLGADVEEIQTDVSGGRAEALRIVLPGNRRVRCRAEKAVLAAGGIENARLLLLSTSRAPAGLGNAHDQVGRCFMDHIYCYAGHLEPSSQHAAKGPHVIERFGDLETGPGAFVAYALDDATRRREGLNGAAAFFVRRAGFQLHPDYDGPGGSAVTYFAELARGERFLDRAALARIGALVRHAPSAARLCLRHATEIARPASRLALRMQIEASPQSDSRVTLSAARDRFGRRRAHVAWRLGESDGHGAQRLWQALADAISAKGLGRMAGAPPGRDGQWPASATGGKHHLGTTRMSRDPKDGVVDPDCRVHGLENLYMAGSSVFPTGGWANPTLTAMALALRLAARMRE